MISRLKKLKIFLIITLFAFSFNALGLANFALAANSSEVAPSNPVVQQGQKIKEVIKTVEAIKGDLSSGVAPSHNLDELDQKVQAINKLDAKVEQELAEIESKLNDLLKNGEISSEILERHRNFVDQYHQKLATLQDTINEIQITPTQELSIQQIDNALQQIKSISPGPKIDILGKEDKLKLPHRRSDISKEGLVSRPTITTGITLPTPEDLTSTIDVQITPEIEDLAGQLGNDPATIFAYVRNNIDYQPYFGSVKGSVGTYWEKAGNDIDQSSLLIGLFRASEIPARYVCGAVELPIVKVMNWVGVEDANVAAEVFSSNGIPSETVTSADGTVTHLLFFHTWVEAYIPKSSARMEYEWVQMNPSFKQYKYYEGIDIPDAMGFNFDTFYNNAVSGATVNEPESWFTNLNESNITSDIETYADNLLSWANTNLSDPTVGDVLGYREIGQITLPQLNNLAQTFPFKTFAPQYELSVIPDHWRYMALFQMYGLDYSTTMPELAGKSLTLSYVPATPYDEWLIEYYGGIFNVLAYLVHMKPQLKVEGSIVAEGDGVTLGTYQVFRSNFLRPLGTYWDTNDKQVTTGADYSVSLDQQRISLDLVKKRVDYLKGLIEGLPPTDPATQEMVEEALHITGLSYFAQCDVLSDVAGKTSKVIWTRQPSQAFVAQDLIVLYWSGVPWSVERGSVNIDVKRNIVNPISTTGNHEDEVSWMLTTGSIGSAAEHAIFEQLYGVESVSTEKILTLANRWNIPIYTIDDTNIDQILLQLDTFDIVKQNIVDAINMGWTAVVPQTNIQLNQWYGAGWIIMDPDTGSAGYLLAGHLVTGSELIIGGGSGTEPIEMDLAHLIIEVLHWLHIFQSFGAGATFVGAAAHYFGALMAMGGLGLAIAGASILAGVGFAMMAIAIVFVLAFHGASLSYRRKEEILLECELYKLC